MSETIRLKKGFDIKLKGEAVKVYDDDFEQPTTFAYKPFEFDGMMPKVLARVGDEVKAGTPLFYDKKNPDALFTSPVSGEVAEISRGDKRVITKFVILADKETAYEDFGAADPADLSREEVVEKLCKSGLWNFIRQRPFSNVPDPESSPKAIFVSCFDTSPLGIDTAFVMEDRMEEFKLGIAALRKLTDGTVHLGVESGGASEKLFADVEGVQLNKFSGPHPAGNVGIHIHHVDPLNKGEYVWYAAPQDIANMGVLFRDGRYDARRRVAVAGQGLTAHHYVDTLVGASTEPMLKGKLKEGRKLRIISGNVLTGSAIEADNYVSFYDDLISVIDEGDEPELFGWILPSYPRPSLSGTFPWRYTEDMRFEVNTNLHGEERAFVVTGQYERVLPMDIYPVYLLKAILTEDVERMEQLGIYEVAPEDLALCEFVCTSKIDVQEIVRNGLNMIQQEAV